MKEYIGKDLKTSLEDIFRQEKPRKVLLVTGKESYQKSPAKAFFDGCCKTIELVTFNDFSPNPKHEEVSRAVNLLAKNVPDLIIGVGGGSVMDFAKLINVYLANPSQLSLDPDQIDDVTPAAPLALIPTTSGSGSESTYFAVVYKGGKKFSVAIKEARAEYVIVDPVLTYSMSPFLTACTGMDALCQATESVWAMGATEQSLQDAVKALEYIVPNLNGAVNNPKPESRRAMALGAFYAGKAINTSKTTGPHAFSYYITTHYGIPHGEAVSMSFPFFIINNFDGLDPERKKILRDIFKFETKEQFVEIFKNIRKDIGLNTTFCSLGINEEPHLTNFLQGVNHQRLSNNPVPIDIEAMKRYICE